MIYFLGNKRFIDLIILRKNAYSPIV